MISIIIPTYNREKIIHRALDSILNQSYTNWECIVVDDGSSDNTEKVVMKYNEIDSRFRYIKNTRSKGAPGARNTGINFSKGDWILLFDSDNFMHPECLERLMLLDYRNYDVITCWSKIIDETTHNEIGCFNWVCDGDIHMKLLEGGCYVDNNSSLIRKSLLLEFPLDENVPSFQEWDTHIRLSTKALYTTCQEYLIDYYRGGTDTISSSLEKEIQGYLYILLKYKMEWKKKSLISFLNYSISLEKLIDKSTRANDYREAYRHIVSPYMRLSIFLLKTCRFLLDKRNR